MSTAIQKGDALEKAVRAIEVAILQSSPAFHESPFVIESKKIVVVDGVRHEVDIYVTASIGPGYDSLFIFECKNWEAAVGKNEIIVFSEKVACLQAQRGFFVAKSFTSDARAQAAKNQRIRLLDAVEYHANSTPVPFDFHFLVNELTDAKINLRQRGSNGAKVLAFDPSTAHLVRAGVEESLSKYIHSWATHTSQEHLRTFRSAMLPEGNYTETAKSLRSFSVSEFVVDDRDIEIAELTIAINLKIVRPPVISHYEVSTRGRVISLTPVSAAGLKIATAFVSN